MDGVDDHARPRSDPSLTWRHGTVDAAASMVAISKGADPAAWSATERCAKLADDAQRAADAHAAFLYVSGLDSGVKKTRDAWAKLGGKISP